MAATHLSSRAGAASAALGRAALGAAGCSGLRRAFWQAACQHGQYSQIGLSRTPVVEATGPLARWPAGPLARWLAAVVQDARALAFLYQQNLALCLDEAQSALDEPIPCVGKSASSRQQQLRRWHRLRLEIKQARYGVELLLDLGSGDPGWLSALTHWQERLGQLQDWR
ncbi:CHAD domain-containing protein [Aeromonas veronii]|uniref:CHAD domain-containing protein n=1 Tax=Aeromonas veronii TaxID=654 RepID=UPI003D1BF1A4